MVAHAGRVGQLRRLHLEPGPALLVAVRGSWPDAPGGRRRRRSPAASQQVVVGDQQAGDDEHRQLRGHRGRFEEPAAVRPDDLVVVDQPRRHTSVEGAAVEGFEDPMVGPLIDVLERSDADRPGLREAGLERQPPLGPGRIEHADLGVRPQPDNPRPAVRKSAPSRLSSA